MGKASKNRRRIREIEAALAGPIVASTPVLTFRGETFEVADRVGLMPLLKFAHLAKMGVDADDMEGLVAIYDLLQSVISDRPGVKAIMPGERDIPSEWERFQDHATAVRATGDDLMEVVGEAIELITTHPSARPSVSSDGPQTTSRSSSGASSERVIRRLEAEGRPSIAYMVRQAQEARDSRASA